MLSKTKIRWINSLERKKNRDEQGVFVSEGLKIVSELLPVLKCRFLATCEKEQNEIFRKYTDEIEQISPEEYKKITFQKSPQGVLAVFEKPTFDIDACGISDNLNLALDDVQDPGNLGTIVRIADWFGIKDIFCSLHSADIYNPKTVQATMGAIARVRVHYVYLPDFLEKVKRQLLVYGTFMDGNSIYTESLTANSVIVLGNEGSGISEEVGKFVTHKITIPRYPAGSITSESLNVGIATAITVAEFRKKSLTQEKL